MKTVTIGRDSSNDIVITDDNSVSRQHLKITQDDNGNYRLIDRGSKNGTYVNGQRKTEYYLRSGDVVTIGLNNKTIPWMSYFAGRDTMLRPEKRSQSSRYDSEYRSSERQPVVAPKAKLRTERSLTKFILLGIVTLGIYDIVVMTHISQEINIVASKHDGKHTMNYLLILLLCILTLGIVGFVWCHRISNRIGDELKRRRIDYHFSAEDYWLWGVLVSMILPFAAWYYNYKLFKAMNLLNASYNKIG